MSIQRFGKSINDAAWNTFTHIISYKAEEAGSKIIFVNPRNTSKECSRCKTIVEKTLRDRIHNCPNCGLSIDRDINAANNILTRATIGTMESNASGDGASALSLKEEAHN